MKIGLIIGSFLPLHNGSLTLCKVAETLTEKLIIVIVDTPKDPIKPQLRIQWLKKEMPNATVTHMVVTKNSYTEQQLQIILTKFSKKFSSSHFHLFSSNPKLAWLAKSLKIKFTILDPARIAQNIKSNDILEDPYLNWLDIPVSVRLSLIKRIVLIGPESVGKSTLATNLKRSFIKYPFLPEYGRPYEVFRDAGPYREHEFDDIIAVHGAHRQALLPFSGPIFIEDTDELATSVWVEMLMGKKINRIENKIKLPFLYLLMNTSVPFVKEKIRYFNDKKRVEFFNKIKSKLKSRKAPYTVLTGDWSAREMKSKKIINNILNEKVNWLKIRE